MKIKSYLPLFPGFYNTIFEPYVDYDAELEHFIENEGDDSTTIDDLDFDNSEYENRVADACVDAIEHELQDIRGLIEIKFEKVVSPREYNFTNDSINVEYTLNKAFLINLRDFLNARVDELDKFIEERYTSRSGFSSFYSNDFNDWLNDLDNLIEGKEVEDIEHKFGSLLETYLFIQGYTVDNLFDAVASETYATCHLKERV